MKTPHRGLRGLEVICDVTDDTLVLLCCLGESKAISIFLDNCSFGCLFSVECVSCRFCVGMNGLETKISRTFLDFLHSGHEFFVISGHGT